MPIATLLRPDNRLLGLGANDFSYYGVQPGSGAVVSRVGPAEALTDPESPATTDDQPVRPNDASEDLASTPVPGSENFAPSSDAPIPTSSFSPAPATTQSPIGDGPQGSAIGGGSTAPLILVQPNAAPPDGSTVSDEPLLSGAGTQLAAAAGIGELADGLGSPLLDTLAGIAPDAAQLGQVQSALDATTDAIGRAVADVGGEVAGTLADAQQQVGAISDTVGTIPSSFDLDELMFTGTDPAGGIATLVDLVQTSELFAVGQAVTPVAPDASGSIVDDLVADATALSPLLGEGDQHHDQMVDDLLHPGS